MNKDLILGEWSRAVSARRAAQLLLADGLYADSVSRAYYAIMHAAKAALYVFDVNARSHDAVRRLFGLHLIRPGQLERQLATYLAQGADDRLTADYDVEVTFGRERAILECERAEAFLRHIREYLLEQGVAPADLPLTPPKR